MGTKQQNNVAGQKVEALPQLMTGAKFTLELLEAAGPAGLSTSVYAAKLRKAGLVSENMANRVGLYIIHLRDGLYDGVKYNIETSKRTYILHGVTSEKQAKQREREIKLRELKPTKEDFKMLRALTAGCRKYFATLPFELQQRVLKSEEFWKKHELFVKSSAAHKALN